MEKNKAISMKTAIAAGIAAVALMFTAKVAMCQDEGGPGGSGQGQMKKPAACEKNPDACEMMKEAMEFCRAKGNSEYCEMSGLPKMEEAKDDKGKGGPGGGMPGGGPGGGMPGGGPGMGGPGMGGPGGGPGGGSDSKERGGGMKDMGVLSKMIKACESTGAECDKLKKDVKWMIDLSKGMKEICGGRDKDACGLVKESKAFCMEQKELCGYGMRGGEEAKYYVELVGECKKEKEREKCDALKVGIRAGLADMRAVQKICEKGKEDSPECKETRELIAVCGEDADKCEQMKKMKMLCASDPAECERVKSEGRRADIEKMKERCKENPAACKENTAQKRKFCNASPGDCDPAMLEMLDEIEKFISQMPE